MQERTASWDDIVVHSHQMCAKVEIYVDDVLERTFEGESSLFTEGQVTSDREANIRTRGTVTFADELNDLTPAEASDLLAPYGTEWIAYRGIVHPDGSKEYMPLGTLIIVGSQISDTGDGLAIRLEGQDRSRKVARSRFTHPYVVQSGTPGDIAIMGIIESQTPGYEFDMGGEEFETPLLTFDVGDDPWKACQKVVDSCGCELYFSRSGVVTMRKIPVPELDSVVWNFEEGGNCTLLNVQRDMKVGDNDGLYNHVIVTGEPVEQQAAVRAEALDDNPASPTYVNGPFGDVPKFYTSKFIKTVEQAQAAADSMLNESLGRYETITFNAVPNTALDLGDVFTISRGMSKLEDVAGVIDLITWPLVPFRGMEIISRRRAI